MRTPRLAQASAEDDTPEGRYIARLNGHHSNSHEIFPLIAAACLAAHACGVPTPLINTIATAFLASRLLHAILYIFLGSAGWAANARALVWLVGLLLVGYLFVQAAQ